MSLQIGQYIKYALSCSTELETAVGGRIYPVILPQDTEPEFPYITFARNTLNEDETKDGIQSDTCQEEIAIFGRDLDEVEAVAQLVRTAMADGWVAWNDNEDNPFTVEDQTLTAGPEDYDLAHDGYFLTMNYFIETD